MKWFAAALAAALLMLQYRVWFSADGVREVIRLRSAVAGQQSDNERLSARNRQLAAEVRDLKQGYSALEERARSDLGMVASNETFFQVGPIESPVIAPPPSTPAVPSQGRPLRPAAAGQAPPARTAAVR
ncbi:MAG TPA: cell division protein FtsB [Steroidobacteraceae bacterium]|nr:cell division protein FtsB [Steroidobacteraceae bacterium]